MTDTPTPGGIGRIGEHRGGPRRLRRDELEHVPTADDAVTLLRRAVELGINHIDTASFYGDGEVNRRIRRALAPYPDDLVIVSKVGARHVSGGAVPLTLAQKPPSCAPPSSSTSPSSGSIASRWSTCGAPTSGPACSPRATRSSTSTTSSPS